MKQSRLFFLLLCVSGFGWSQTPRWVVVNFQRVFEEFTELKQADADVKKEIQAFRDEQAKRLESHNVRKQAFQKLREQAASADVAGTEREALVDEAAKLFEDLRSEEQELQKLQVEFNQQAEAKIVRLRKEFSDQVREHIRKMAEERDWGVVIDSSAVGSNGLPVIHYVESTQDVTVDVVRSLNASVAETETEEETGE